MEGAPARKGKATSRTMDRSRVKAQQGTRASCSKIVQSRKKMRSTRKLEEIWKMTVRFPQKRSWIRTQPT